MQLMSQFGKIHLYGLMRNVECSSKDAYLDKVPPNEQADEFAKP